mgnify:CR=1 FL=1
MAAEVASAEQQQWQDICAAVRAQLAKAVEWMPAMNPDEVASLIEAIDTAIWTETKAASFDESVEQRRAEMTRGAAYGG